MNLAIWVALLHSSAKANDYIRLYMFDLLWERPLPLICSDTFTYWVVLYRWMYHYVSFIKYCCKNNKSQYLSSNFMFQNHFHWQEQRTFHMHRIHHIIYNQWVCQYNYECFVVNREYCSKAREHVSARRWVMLLYGDFSLDTWLLRLLRYVSALRITEWSWYSETCL